MLVGGFHFPGDDYIWGTSTVGRQCQGMCCDLLDRSWDVAGFLSITLHS